MIRSLSAVSIAALLAATPGALAQAQKPDAAEKQTEMNKDGMKKEMKQDDSTTTGQSQSSDEATTGREVAGQIVLQDDNTFLASDLMNTNVYASNAEDAEAVGDINDIIFAKGGEVQGVVIGVGGFLGIGEKDVAIKNERLDLQETDDGIKIVLETTKEELEKAPAFKSKGTQKAEAKAQKAKQDAETRMKNPGAVPANPDPQGDQKKPK